MPAGFLAIMASLLPIIDDILPMILPSSVSITKSIDIIPPIPPVITTANGGSHRVRVYSRDAVVNKLDKVCSTGTTLDLILLLWLLWLLLQQGLFAPWIAVYRENIVTISDNHGKTVLILSPTSYSTIRHYGEQDAIIYVALGRGVLLTASKDEEDSEPERHELSQGDFAAVPAWTEHQVLNESAEQDTHWVIIRSGSHPVEVHLKGWGRGKAEYPPSRA